MKLEYVKITERKDLMLDASIWFEDKWGISKDAYYECMEECVKGKSKYDWYLCLDDNKIVGGLGVIDNDFHDREDLSPNVCAVYVEEEYRNNGIAGILLNMVVSDMKNKGITPIYLVTDHTSFYERYGWEFFTLVNASDGIGRLNIYIDRKREYY